MPERRVLRALVFLLVLAPLLAGVLAPATGFGRATTASPTGSPTPTPGPQGPIAGIPGTMGSPVATEGGGELVGVEGNAYVSPTWGYRLTWDPTMRYAVRFRADGCRRDDLHR
jgi:hypothetical protein